jgi:hypothetical protein
LREEQTKMSDLYDGQATVRHGDDARVVRVRLAGRVDPIDGRYHWQGTVHDTLPDDVRLPRQVTVSIDGRDADARITERPPQGGYSVSGVGAPPYPLGDG